MTTVISFINLKGGVGKTTTAVGTAMFLAERGNKVLFIDLDPQANATLMLLGEKEYKKLNDQDKTLYTLFRDAVSGNGNTSIDDLIRERAGSFCYSGTQSLCPNLDLLPSSMKLIDVQEELLLAKAKNKKPEMILEQALGDVIDDYKYVIVDCPPSVGTITQNGLRISTHYIIPVVPEYLSVQGAEMVNERMDLYANEWKKEIKLVGVVATKFQTAMTRHRFYLNIINAWPWGNAFVTNFRQMTALSRAAECPETPTTLSARWGLACNIIYNFVTELLRRL